MYLVLLLFTFRVSALFTLQPAAAAEGDASVSSRICTKDRMSLQMVSGFISSPTDLASTAIDMDYWQTNFRPGWMFSGLKMSDTRIRGRFEAFIEGTFSIISDGPGDYPAGLTALNTLQFFTAYPTPGWMTELWGSTPSAVLSD